jgi:aspartyl-tRNA(Asn)/glutamyl-tRNA(Gln) amidotransferase subunit C
MSLSEKEVRKIAKLSRIKLTDQKVKHFQQELSNIFAWIEQLQEVNTDKVPPMSSVVNMHSPVRKDLVTEGNCREDVLANAPSSEYGCFVVPKMVE